MKTNKLLTLYPVTDPEQKALGFSYFYKQEKPIKSTLYFSDKETAVKMLEAAKKLS